MHVCQDSVHLDSLGLPVVSSRPLGSHQSTPYLQFVCVFVYTHIHTRTLPAALKIEKTQTVPLSLLLSKTAQLSKQQVPLYTSWTPPSSCPNVAWTKCTYMSAYAHPVASVYANMYDQKLPIIKILFLDFSAGFFLQQTNKQLLLHTSVVLLIVMPCGESLGRYLVSSPRLVRDHDHETYWVWQLGSQNPLGLAIEISEPTGFDNHDQGNTLSLEIRNYCYVEGHPSPGVAKSHSKCHDLIFCCQYGYGSKRKSKETSSFLTLMFRMI